ncbi:MAG: AAA family ATPase [Chloroflexota bacterium]|nr:AAA family ATPase [Chloroflexota bacterium]
MNVAPALPHDLDLERAVLGQALERGRVAAGVETDDFFRHCHAVTWRRILDANRRDLSAELPIVQRILTEHGEIDTVGVPYLHQIAKDTIPLSVAGLASVAQQLRELRRKRDIATLVIRYAADPAAVDLETLNADLQVLRVAACAGQKATFRTPKELAEAAERVAWIVRGYLAKGAITELTGKAKVAGKTTLVAHVVAAVLDGAYCLGGTATQTRAVILTEQTHSTFREVLRRSHLLHREDLSILSYWDVKGRPWPAIAEMADLEADRIGADLLVVDTLAQFAGIKGDGENNAGDALEALAPLQQIAHRGRAILITRHARKGGGEVGEDGRGSTAFTGGVDVVLSLKRPEGNHRPTLRVLEGLSRFDETPTKLVIEKVSARCPSPDLEVWADSFQVLGDTDAVEGDEAKDALLRMLPTSEGEAVSMDDLEDATGQKRVTLQRAIKSIQGVQTIGKGRKGDPLRYFRPEFVSAQTSNPVGTHGQNADEDADGEAEVDDVVF